MTPPDPLGALVAPPTTGLPVAGSPPGQPGGNAGNAAAGEFELLVGRLLAGTGEEPAATATPVADGATSPTGVAVPPADLSTDSRTRAAAVPATGAGTDQAGTDEAGDGDGSDPAATATAVLPDAAWLLPPALVRAAIASTPAPAPGATEMTGATPSVPAPAHPGGTPPPGGTTGPESATAPGESTPVAAPSVALPDTGPSAPTTPSTSGESIAPVTGAAATRLDATAPAPAAVTRQVFPEVVRLAATGEGTATQRVTLMLRPESLGEVRVVLTTRHGELQVSLSAGGDTHRALLEGTPELRRLLETIGSPDARVVVRDLPGGPPASAPQASASRADTPTDLSGGPGAGTAHPGDGSDPRPSGRESTTATDGTHDAATPQRRTESVTRARSTGLDVTM